MIHLVYPHRNSTATPHAIGHNLLQRLSRSRKVVAHDFDRTYSINPEPGDVLIGHAHPVPGTVMRRSLQESGWSRKILMQPYAPEWDQVGFLDQLVDHCDLFLAITGKYWFENPTSWTKRWMPKMVHLDLAVDRTAFPRIRTSVNAKGNRKFVYIGLAQNFKNLPYLNEIARNWGGGKIDWIGRGPPLEHVKNLGFVDFSKPEGRAVVAEYDFMITVGYADANPTTILEAMSWGISPICTPTSGYINEPSIINVPLNDVTEACKTLDHLQFVEAPEDIAARREAAAARLDEHYNWDRFSRQVLDAIDSDASPPIKPSSARPFVATRQDQMRLHLRNVLYRVEGRVPWLGLQGPVLKWLRRILRK